MPGRERQSARGGVTVPREDAGGFRAAFPGGSDAEVPAAVAAGAAPEHPRAGGQALPAQVKVASPAANGIETAAA